MKNAKNFLTIAFASFALVGFSSCATCGGGSCCGSDGCKKASSSCSCKEGCATKEGCAAGCTKACCAKKS